MTPRFFTALLALLLVLSARGQQPAELPRVTGAVETTVVNIDVVVTDRKGSPVTGLKAEDFEVWHDRKPVTITNFSEVRAAEPAPAPAGAGATSTVAVPQAPSEPYRPHRIIVLYFDRLALFEKPSRDALFGSLGKLLDRTLGPGDEATVVAWNRSMKTVLPLTDDREEIDAALREVEKQSARLPHENSDLDAVSADAAWLRSLPAAAAAGGTNQLPRSLAAQALADQKSKTAALKGLLATLGGMDGRKILVLASHRFSRYAGEEFFLGKRETGQGAFSSDVKEFDAKGLLEELTDSANAQRVTLYTLFPEGWEMEVPSASDSRDDNPSLDAPPVGRRSQLVWSNEMEALDFVAERTGGLSASGPAAIREVVAKVANDLDSYYSIGYSPPASGSGRFAVTVKVKNRDLVVRTRRSLVEKAPEEKMMDRVLANLFSRDRQGHLPIAVSAQKAVAKKGQLRVTLEVQVPIGRLALLPAARGVKGAFSVFVAAAGAGGEFSDVTRQRRAFEIPSRDLARAKAGHYTYELDVLVNSRNARVSVGVWDEFGREAGFAVVAPPPS
jgi:VWFA-related protein